jgi:hypothetical protein
MRIKILKKLSYLKKEYEIGKIIEVKDDGSGMPIDSFWRNRIKDSEIDNCVEVLRIKPKKEDKNVKYK